MSHFRPRAAHTASSSHRRAPVPSPKTAAPMAPQRSLSSLGGSMRSFSMRSISARWRATSQHEDDAGEQPPDTIGRAGSLLRDLEPAPAVDEEEAVEYLLSGPVTAAPAQQPQLQQQHRTQSADDGVAPVVVDVARFRTAPARRGGSGGAGGLEALHGSNGGHRAPPPAASSGMIFFEKISFFLFVNCTRVYRKSARLRLLPHFETVCTLCICLGSSSVSADSCKERHAYVYDVLTRAVLHFLRVCLCTHCNVHRHGHSRLNRGWYSCCCCCCCSARPSC
jgi:hypothetical protein